MEPRDVLGPHSRLHTERDDCVEIERRRVDDSGVGRTMVEQRARDE